MSFTETLQSITGKLLADCTDQELYLALLELVRQRSADRVQPVTGRKLYYISAEFLIGKLLSNNLINLGLYDEARSALAAAGKRLSDIEEVEPEPSLGNGGLGRLAACFLDSLATLNLPGDGVGLRYHFGLFHQSFEDGVQNEKPDPWLTAHSWAEKTDTTYPVELAGKEYTARLYKLAVTGYEGRTNTLNLFDLDTIDESIVHDGIAFDKTAIDKNLTLFLYPDDSDEAGRRLRVYQQYLRSLPVHSSFWPSAPPGAATSMIWQTMPPSRSTTPIPAWSSRNSSVCWASAASSLRRPWRSLPRPALTPTTPFWPKHWKSGPAPIWMPWCRS